MLQQLFIFKGYFLWVQSMTFVVNAFKTVLHYVWACYKDPGLYLFMSSNAVGLMGAKHCATWGRV